MYNINNIVRQAQSHIFPDQEIVFTNSTVEWVETSRKPVKTEETITLKGRLQPVDPAIYQQLGFNINEYQYYRVYISNITPTQADKIRH